MLILSTRMRSSSGSRWLRSAYVIQLRYRRLPRIFAEAAVDRRERLPGRRLRERSRKRGDSSCTFCAWTNASAPLQKTGCPMAPRVAAARTCAMPSRPIARRLARPACLTDRGTGRSSRRWQAQVLLPPGIAVEELVRALPDLRRRRRHCREPAWTRSRQARRPGRRSARPAAGPSAAGSR